MRKLILISVLAWHSHYFILVYFVMPRGLTIPHQSLCLVQQFTGPTGRPPSWRGSACLHQILKWDSCQTALQDSQCGTLLRHLAVMFISLILVCLQLFLKRKYMILKWSKDKIGYSKTECCLMLIYYVWYRRSNTIAYGSYFGCNWSYLI